MPPGSMPFSNIQWGYCTNVHPGTDLSTICARLEEFAVPIARKSPPDRKLGVGLWLPATAAQELHSPAKAVEFGKWLSERRLRPFTINGFPYENFHLPVVKHRVYRPTWAEKTRFEYTVLLAEILASLLSSDATGQQESGVGSISTLPIGWPGEDDAAVLDQAGKQLRQLAVELQSIEAKSGRRIVVAIEPEPGCLLDRCSDIVDFFNTQLPEANHRRYLGVCHDVCHSAVMFEEQADTLERYAKAGLLVGKVQVSSAIDVPFLHMAAEERVAAVDQLRSFAEDRYLHQTGCLDSRGHFRLDEDLPNWLDSTASQDDKHLRIHFHVPIFLKRFGALRSTQDDIRACIDAMRSPRAPDFTEHWEVETYAWSVMPNEMRTDGLGADIARELAWFEEAIALPTLTNGTGANTHD